MTFEAFLVEQCAPVLAGIKPGSLFPYILGPGEELWTLLDHWNQTLAAKGVQAAAVKRCSRTGAYLIYVFRPDQVKAVLARPEVKAFLQTYGYAPGQGIPEALSLLTRRLCMQEEFPHEVGIFLGYPLHDVQGFICHKGKNSLCSGCWKVYAEPQKAQRLFRRYRLCTQVYRAQFRQGKSAAQLTVAA